MKTEKKQDKIEQRVERLLERKRLIHAYVHGKISLEQLDERGIKLALPI